MRKSKSLYRGRAFTLVMSRGVSESQIRNQEWRTYFPTQYLGWLKVMPGPIDLKKGASELHHFSIVVDEFFGCEFCSGGLELSLFPAIEFGFDIGWFEKFFFEKSVELVCALVRIGIDDLEYSPIEAILLRRTNLFYFLDGAFVLTIRKQQKSVTQRTGDASILFREVQRRRGHLILF